MLNPDSFKLDIKQLRELWSSAPLAEFERAKWRILADYRLSLPPKERPFVTELSHIYASIARAETGSSVYTPPLLAGELFSRCPVRPGDRILDCAAGTGALAAPFVRAGHSVSLMDPDETALAIAGFELPGCELIQGDFLTAEGSWDIIIGNPPYEGHKTMTLEAKTLLRARFGEIMGNKADLHFAFFAKAHELLVPGGTLAFLVSRYWLEAESGQALRRFLLERFTIRYLHDWYGERPFGAGVDPILIVLTKGSPQRDYDIEVRREDAGDFTMPSTVFSPDIMKPLTPAEVRLRRIIESETAMTLAEAGSFHQGIITGFDKAFIMTREEARARGIEADLLVDWIKSTDLRGRREALQLVYADEAAGERAGFMTYIEQHRARLENRREVRLGRIQFYQLQWGRDRSLFQARRILFPYKAPRALFVPGQNLYHSADIYSYRTKLDETWLCRILNSPIYDAYIKTALKKLGRDLYEYYPHRLGAVRIPDPTRWPEADAFLDHLTRLVEGNDHGTTENQPVH